MTALPWIVILGSCVYLQFVTLRMLQTAVHSESKHEVLTTVIVSGLAASALVAVGVLLLLIVTRS